MSADETREAAASAHSAETHQRLYLPADGLLSKWGFGDGDVPDWLLDYCDEHDLPYPEDWHGALRALVRTHLVPALEQQVQVYDIETIHNPIRAESIDGTPVPDSVMYSDLDGPTLTPTAVEVPLSAVLDACGLLRKPPSQSPSGGDA